MPVSTWTKYSAKSMEILLLLEDLAVFQVQGEHRKKLRRSLLKMIYSFSKAQR